MFKNWQQHVLKYLPQDPRSWITIVVAVLAITASGVGAYYWQKQAHNTKLSHDIATKFIPQNPTIAPEESAPKHQKPYQAKPPQKAEKTPTPVVITPNTPPKPQGDLPRYLKNAQPTPPIPDNAPVIAVVIDDMGVHGAHSLRMLHMPSPVTMAFLPYGSASLDLAQKAHQQGHEIMIHVPMEPKMVNGNIIDPGPNALLLNDTLAENMANLKENLSNLLPYAMGANNHMGSAFTESLERLKPVLSEIAKQELLFIDSLTTANSAVQEAARGLNLPLLTRDVFIDHYHEPEKVMAALKQTEEVAKKQGYAIAIGHPHPVTFKALQTWIPTLEKKGIELVPVSYLVQYAAQAKSR